MKSMENNKSPGNNGLTKEFYVTFWDDIKTTFISSTKQAKERKKLSIFHKYLHKLRMFKIGTSTKAEDYYQIILKLPIYNKWKVFWCQWTLIRLLTHNTTNF